MKDCNIYYRMECVCNEKDICYENDGECPYMRVKEKCKTCNEDILECYICNKE